MKNIPTEHKANLTRPVLTVIVPVFERQAELDRALESLLAQDFPFSVVVVDDASPVPIRINPRFSTALDTTLLRCDRNGGAAQARNLGLERATTDWVTFLDSDDSLIPETLSSRWAFLEADQQKNPDSTVIYGCGWHDIDEGGLRLSTRYPRPGYTTADFASGCWFCPGSCVILNRKAVMRSVGLQNTRLRRLEDYEWFLRMGLAGFTLKTQALVGAKIERKRHIEVQSVTDSVQQILKDFSRYPISAALRRRIHAYLALETAAAKFFNGSRLGAAVWVARSLFSVPRTRLHLAPGWRYENAS